MINRFASLSIKGKLVAIAIGSSAMSLLLASLILVVININDVKQKSQEDLSAVAALIANRSVAAVMFDDAKLAQENLSSLNSMADLLSACLYNKKGLLFTELNRTLELCPAETQLVQPESSSHSMTLLAFQPMVMDDELVGSVLITADVTSALLRQLKSILLIMLTMFGSMVATFFLTSHLLGKVSEPIRLLVRDVQRVTKKHDFSIRAKKISDDETGILVDAFNEMLQTVDDKNKALIGVKNKYQALYDNNPTMVFDLDQHGNINSVNHFGAHHLGKLVDELLGESIMHYSHPEDLLDMQNFFRRCQQQPAQVHKQDSRIICHSGHIIWVRKTAHMVSDENNQQHIFLVCEDISENRRLAEKIAYQAAHDDLTGLVNRRQFDSMIQNLVSLAHADNSSHALCYLDLDQFKVVNDTCGHLAGDELLRQLGDVLKQQVRKSDVLARLGGDEFGVLMANCSMEQATQIADKLRNCICDFQFAWENRSFSIAVSIGIAPINRTSGNAVDILKEADAACYAAKEKGRNRVHVFSPNDDELAKRQGEMQWVEKIRSGIEQNRFQLYGQLIVPTGTHCEGLHFETLLRYQDENGNIIPPGAFLPAAERYNMAPTLDRWVISALFKHLATAPGLLERLEICSVNLSGLSLSDENMLDYISDEFRKWQIPTYKICFEITETAAIGNLSNAQDFIDVLRRKGCSFSLDDFGSGLSSFAYLKHLPVDFLKIDGLFVKDILEDKVDWSMVKAINEVGHVMNKKTIAEFVENQKIFQMLQDLGVNYAQGYGIAKPVPLQEL